MSEEISADSENFKRFKKRAVEVLAVEDSKVVPEADFAADLDADSLDIVEFVMALEEEFGIEINEEELEGVTTVSAAFDLITLKALDEPKWLRRSPTEQPETTSRLETPSACGRHRDRCRVVSRNRSRCVLRRLVRSSYGGRPSGDRLQYERILRQSQRRPQSRSFHAVHDGRCGRSAGTSW